MANLGDTAAHKLENEKNSQIMMYICIVTCRCYLYLSSLFAPSAIVFVLVFPPKQKPSSLGCCKRSHVTQSAARPGPLRLTPSCVSQS